MSPTMSDARPRIKVWQPWFDTNSDEGELRRRAAQDDWTRTAGAHGLEAINRGVERGGLSPAEVVSHDKIHLDRHTGSIPSSSIISRVDWTSAHSDEGPLDMSVNRRSVPPPPPYQSPSRGSACSPHLRRSPPVDSSREPSDKSRVISDSVCDSTIDEHFRRSLGQQYHAVFNTSHSSSQHRSDLPTATSSSSSMEDTGSGTSVDDHFAKALGDTWLQLKDNCSEKKVSNGLQLAR